MREWEEEELAITLLRGMLISIKYKDDFPVLLFLYEYRDYVLHILKTTPIDQYNIKFGVCSFFKKTP